MLFTAGLALSITGKRRATPLGRHIVGRATPLRRHIVGRATPPRALRCGCWADEALLLYDAGEHASKAHRERNRSPVPEAGFRREHVSKAHAHDNWFSLLLYMTLLLEVQNRSQNQQSPPPPRKTTIRRRTLPRRQPERTEKKHIQDRIENDQQKARYPLGR